MSAAIPIVDCNTVVGAWAKRKVDLSAQTLMSLMKRYGVARSLFVSTTAIFYDYRQGNDEAVEIARQSGGVLLPVASVDPRQWLDCFSEIDKRVNQGFRLFRFFPDLQRWPLNFAPFKDIIAKLKEVGRPFMISAQALGTATQIAELVRDFGQPVILTHAHYSNLGEILCLFKRLPNLYAETHLLNAPDSYEIFASEVGADRLIFGSFAPLKYLASALLPLQHSALSEEDKRKVLVENIRKILSA